MPPTSRDDRVYGDDDRQLLVHLSRQVQALDEKLDDARGSQETLARAQVAIETKLESVDGTCTEMHGRLLGETGLMAKVIDHAGRLTRVESDLRTHISSHERGDFARAEHRFDAWKVTLAAFVGAFLAWIVRKAGF